MQQLNNFFAQAGNISPKINVLINVLKRVNSVPSFEVSSIFTPVKIEDIFPNGKSQSVCSLVNILLSMIIIITIIIIIIINI